MQSNPHVTSGVEKKRPVSMLPRGGKFSLAITDKERPHDRHVRQLVSIGKRLPAIVVLRTPLIQSWPRKLQASLIRAIKAQPCRLV